ncbi:hypothetical protein Tco_0766149 [Tanacetum coccineum]
MAGENRTQRCLHTDLTHKANRVLILARTNLSQHNFRTSQLHDFFTTSRLPTQLHRLYFNTLLMQTNKLTLPWHYIFINTAGQHVNTASPEVNTGRFKLNNVDPSVNIASSSDPDNPKDMFTMGASHTLEATHVEFFSDEDEPEVDLGNILNSYTVPTTPNTKIHIDHPIKNVIGDVKSSVQTRRMAKPTSEQGFLSAVYKEKSHDTLNTYLYACFLSQIEPTSIAKALSDSS